MDLFFAQDDDYRKLIIGDEPVRIAIEAGVRQGWDAIIGTEGTFHRHVDLRCFRPIREAI
jgi:transketolase